MKLSKDQIRRKQLKKKLDKKLRYKDDLRVERIKLATKIVDSMKLLEDPKDKP
jgi:LPS O-antigen subunit length determinant protein (WzzB/FepE family)